MWHQRHIQQFRVNLYMEIKCHNPPRPPYQAHFKKTGQRNGRCGAHGCIHATLSIFLCLAEVFLCARYRLFLNKSYIPSVPTGKCVKTSEPVKLEFGFEATLWVQRCVTTICYVLHKEIWVIRPFFHLYLQHRSKKNKQKTPGLALRHSQKIQPCAVEISLKEWNQHQTVVLSTP